MTDTNTSGADVLAAIDSILEIEDSCGGDEYCGSDECRTCAHISVPFNNMKAARTAVAALIARNAELEAERDDALRRANRADARVKGWESTMVVRGLPRRLCPVEGWGPGEGETVEIPALTTEKLTEILDRVDALAAEVKALDSEACKLRGELYALRNMLEGYEVSVQRNQLHGAGLTYLTEVQLLREFQPGVGESHAEWWKKTLARASAATGGRNG